MHPGRGGLEGEVGKPPTVDFSALHRLLTCRHHLSDAIFAFLLAYLASFLLVPFGLAYSDAKFREAP